MEHTKARILICMPVENCVEVSRIEHCRDCEREVGVSSTSPKVDKYICFQCFLDSNEMSDIQPPTLDQMRHAIEMSKADDKDL